MTAHERNLLLFNSWGERGSDGPGGVTPLVSVQRAWIQTQLTSLQLPSGPLLHRLQLVLLSGSQQIVLLSPSLCHSGTPTFTQMHPVSRSWLCLCCLLHSKSRSSLSSVNDALLRPSSNTGPQTLPHHLRAWWCFEIFWKPTWCKVKKTLF